MSEPILIVEDDDDFAGLLCEGLRNRGLGVGAVNSARRCLDRVGSGTVDVVVTDVRMPGMSGIELCEELRQRHPDLLTIVLTGNDTVDQAIAAMRAGVYDFLVKPVQLDTLAIAIGRALENLSLRREVRRLGSRVKHDPIEGIVGTSHEIGKTVELIRRVADCDATVMITGESGSGKELVARSLHRLSERHDQPFVAINCAAIPAQLMESELFGHVRGAFTDAKRDRPGLFAQAGTGTIFLDEIGEMPLDIQVKLLRVLQERSMRPVGGDEEAPFRARVVVATNRDLESEVANKRFREDLYYRINVVAIPVPPLRVRGFDILALAQYFLERIASRSGKPVRGITPQVARLLLDYEWPGNVRELENCMERAVALCRFEEITIDDLPAKVCQSQRSSMTATLSMIPGEMLALEEVDRRYVRHVVAMSGGNKSRAAKILGIDRRSVYRYLEQPGESAPQLGAPARPPGLMVPPPAAGVESGASGM